MMSTRPNSSCLARFGRATLPCGMAVVCVWRRLGGVVCGTATQLLMRFVSLFRLRLYHKFGSQLAHAPAPHNRSQLPRVSSAFRARYPPAVANVGTTAAHAPCARGRVDAMHATHWRMARRAANAERATRFLREHGLGGAPPRGAMEGAETARAAKASVRTTPSVGLTAAAAAAAVDAGALEVTQVRGHSPLYRGMVVCTALSARHARAVADEVARSLGDAPRAAVHDRRSPWVVVDAGGTIVHVLTREERATYQIERVWDANDPLSMEEAEAIETEDKRAE